jgi:hypothetical protein
MTHHANPSPRVTIEDYGRHSMWVSLGGLHDRH